MYSKVILSNRFMTLAACPCCILITYNGHIRILHVESMNVFLDINVKRWSSKLVALFTLSFNTFYDIVLVNDISYVLYRRAFLGELESSLSLQLY